MVFFKSGTSCLNILHMDTYILLLRCVARGTLHSVPAGAIDVGPVEETKSVPSNTTFVHSAEFHNNGHSASNSFARATLWR